MKPIIVGKTKDVYRLEDGNYLLKFKDDVTGENGVFDPGANAVGLTLAGAGQAALRLSDHFFRLLAAKGVATHFIAADIPGLAMTVRAAEPFGAGLEVICRYRAVGSFYRRYGMYIGEGAKLDAFIEFTLKDDARHDPPITEAGLELLGLLTAADIGAVKQLTRQISAIIKDELAQIGVELYDIKLEFGRLGRGGPIALIDEISGGNLRAYKGGKAIDPLTLAALVLAQA